MICAIERERRWKETSRNREMECGSFYWKRPREKERLKAYKCNELRLGRLRNIAGEQEENVASIWRRSDVPAVERNTMCVSPEGARWRLANSRRFHLRETFSTVRGSLPLLRERWIPILLVSALSNGKFTSLHREQRKN